MLIREVLEVEFVARSNSWLEESEVCGGLRGLWMIGGLDRRPRWSKIFLMTLGSSMAAMILILPLHLGHVSTSISISNTRFKSLAQCMWPSACGPVHALFVRGFVFRLRDLLYGCGLGLRFGFWHNIFSVLVVRRQNS